jgi:SRSO17 transposase
VEQGGRAEEPVGQHGGDLDAWDEAFATFHARFARFFYRREVRERSARYLRGLLGPVERKNGWQVAEAVGEADPQGIQRLLRVARWAVDAVRDELMRFVAEQFGDADGSFVVDETGFVKKGAKSAGVQRQYTGTVGKTENCQVGVFLT